MLTVQVYRNLNRGNWSIRRGGRVVAHVPACVLRNVRFHVGKDQARVARGGARSVHAWASGELIPALPAAAGELVSVTYRPRDRDCFFDRDTGARIDGAKYAVFTAARGMFVSFSH